jgi:DNA polymerase (family 10)
MSVSAKIPYEKALELANLVRDKIRDGNGKKIKTVIVGSIRRRVELVNDIDLLILSDNKEILKQLNFVGLKIQKEISNGKLRRMIQINGIKIDCFLASPSNRAFALFHHTGSAAYNIRIRAHAKKLGYKLNQYGLFLISDGDAAISLNAKTEKDICNLLNITYYTPSSRK